MATSQVRRNLWGEIETYIELFHPESPDSGATLQGKPPYPRTTSARR